MRFPYRVSISDAETFVVDAYTKDCYCFWVIELDWASQGRVGTLVIADRGDPFRLTGSSNATQICTVLGPDGPEECRTSP